MPIAPSTAQLTDLEDFRDYHKNKTIIVCGCGRSLTTLKETDEYITIGVNDVGRLFPPDYLVVLNALRTFTTERRQWIEATRPQQVFSQLNIQIPETPLARFKLGRRGGTDISQQGVLPYSNNSPYVAVCLARLMGAKRIGMIGVDFSEDHFFGKTGKHNLRNTLPLIERHFKSLTRACHEDGTEIYNLNPASLLKAVPKIFPESIKEETPDIIETEQVVKKHIPQHPVKKPAVKNTTNRVDIEIHRPGIVGDFLDDLARTAQMAGFDVVRTRFPARGNSRSISVVWNGRQHRSAGRTLYCEHGWLPRTDYQISRGGINADSHFAPWTWDGESITKEEKEALEIHLESIRNSDSTYEFMQPRKPAVTDLPDEYLLVPLQMEWDTNIVRHVPAKFRRMQNLIDVVEDANPPWPVIFKQHPADRNRGNRQLKLRLSRKCNQLRAHNDGNIHQLLKSSDRCKAIITLNSNVAHDGLLWGIPSIVLGKNIWPRGERLSPFMHAIPPDWSRFEEWNLLPETRACRDAYMHFIRINQWTRKDVRNEEKVTALLKSVPENGGSDPVAPAIVKLRGAQPVINVVAANWGWLFEDLKRHFVRRCRPDVIVRSTEKPIRHADAWIFIRTKEAARTPDLSRTLVQIHDLYDDGCYLNKGDRSKTGKCAAWTLTHPDQKAILKKNSIHLDPDKTMLRPIGAPESFTQRVKLSKQFTIGWAGRPIIHKGEDIKRVQWVMDAVLKLKEEAHVILLGDKLNPYRDQLRDHGIPVNYRRKSSGNYSSYPEIYKQMDCVLITSKIEAGPFSLFESLASGVPVIATKVGWAPELIKNGENGFLVDTVDEVTEAIHKIQKNRSEWFERRHEIRASLKGYTLESWIDNNIDLALKLVQIKN
jgi:glycosyltransferase involved in cell wall biosynthesis